MRSFLASNALIADEQNGKATKRMFRKRNKKSETIKNLPQKTISKFFALFSHI